MQPSPSSIKISPFDLMSAIIKGKVDPSNVSSEAAAEAVSILFESREFLMLLTTSVAVLIGCVVLFIWRRSNGHKKSKEVESLKPAIVKEEPDLDVDDGLKKVTIFFGTQTGTAEGFAKVHSVVNAYLYM